MTEAIFGLVGVIIGAFLSGAVALAVDARRDRRDCIVAARLVSHEISMLSAEIEFWIKAKQISTDALPLPRSSWDENRVALARALPAPDWEMVSATYTWVDLINGDPLTSKEMNDDLVDYYRSVHTEMTGGIKSLEPLVEGMRPRVPLRIRWQRRRKVLRAQKNAYS